LLQENGKILVSSTVESFSVVCEDEVVVMFVTVDSEIIARNISEMHKII
jgi:hypothetical protein